MMHPCGEAWRVFICALIASSATNGDLEKSKSFIVESMISNTALLTTMSNESINQNPEPSLFQDIPMGISKNGNYVSNDSTEAIKSGKTEVMNFSLLGVDSLSPFDLSQTRSGQITQLESSSFSGDSGWLDSLLAEKPIDLSLIRGSRSFMIMDPLLERLGSFAQMDSSFAKDTTSFSTWDPSLIKDSGSNPDTSSAGDLTSLTSRNGNDVSFLPIESFIGSITPNNLVQPKNFTLTAARGTKLPRDASLVVNPGIVQSIDISLVATSDPFITNISSLLRRTEPKQFMDVSFIGGRKDILTQSPTNGQSLSQSSVGNQTKVHGVERSLDLPPWFDRNLTLGPAILQNPESIGSLKSTNHNFRANLLLSDGKPQIITSHMSGLLEVPKTTIGEPSLKVFEKLPLIGNIHETVWKISKEFNAQTAINNIRKTRVKGLSSPDPGTSDLSRTDPVSIPGDPVIVDNPQLQQDLSTGTAQSIHSESDLLNTGLKPVSMSELLNLLNSKSDQIGNKGIDFFNLGTPINNKTHQAKASPANAF
ncbi:hypothetical protein CHS0354_024863 [Potamilus streckersoni]|uniref:Uncharacterized protein n=1 Tax=Potamilus streckersoni TaxID=2493646 RepID=A0AAE0VZC4_9BIVA|nr:hypothetical protein CHS0354_024863 [Potamilus streckersoni]